MFCVVVVSVTHLDAGQRCQLSKVGSTSENFVGSGCLPVVYILLVQVSFLVLVCSYSHFLFYSYCYLNTMDHCCFYCGKDCQEICTDCQIYAFCSPDHWEYHRTAENTCLPFKVNTIFLKVDVENKRNLKFAEICPT